MRLQAMLPAVHVENTRWITLSHGLVIESRNNKSEKCYKEFLLLEGSHKFGKKLIIKIG